MYDIIIIGAGPSGLTAAIYGSRANKKVLVLEKNAYGGQIINTKDIENYPGVDHINGFDFATNLYNQAKNLGAEIKYQKVVSINDLGDIKEVVTSKEKYQCKAVIIATGNDNRKLNLPNEDKLIGKGISYCATCDGNFYKNKTVAVVGGGNTALEDALYLSDICLKIYLIHRRDSFRGEEKTVNLLKEKDNIEFVLNSNITSINGSDDLESIDVTNNNGETKTLTVNGLFIAIGRVPENDVFSNLVELDNNGYIKSGEDCLTNVKGIFVAGDNRTKEVRQLVTATGDGAVAATKAVKYINEL
jgi:thioredoxin reductase (NADPH)